MPLHVRSISASIAVVSFFAVSLIGWISELSPFTCCKRALTAAFIVYITTALAVKAINAILINAMVNSHMNQQKEKTSDNRD
ncbi:MAG: hypothetical protein ACYSSL_06270 [Planctomycetota bacterium]|jgi:hypothetical protein